MAKKTKRKNKKGLELVEAAIDKDIVKVKKIIRSGVNINLKSEFGNTALMRACSNKDINMIRLLIKAGAKDIANKDGQSGLMYVCTFEKFPKRLEMVKLLIKAGADVDVCSRFGQNPLVDSSEHGDIRMVKELIKVGANLDIVGSYDYTALMQASDQGNINIVKELIKAGADVNKHSDENKRTALMYASCSGYNVSKNKINKIIEVVKMLIKAGADVNARDDNKRCALHKASIGGCKGVIEILLKNKANVNARDIWGYSPLMCASERSDKSNRYIVKMLIKAGADVNARNNAGTNALVYASDKEIIKLLTKAGATKEEDDFRTPETYGCDDWEPQEIGYPCCCYGSNPELIEHMIGRNNKKMDMEIIKKLMDRNSIKKIERKVEYIIE